MQYKSENKLFEELLKIEYCDLKNDETSYNQAYKFCKKIMQCFAHAQTFTPDQSKLIQTLKSIGACSYDDINKNLVTTEKLSVNEMLNKNNDLMFPVFMFNQIFNKDNSNFSYFWFKVVKDGGQKYSWINTWINSQKENNVEK